MRSSTLKTQSFRRLGSIVPPVSSKGSERFTKRFVHTKNVDNLACQSLEISTFYHAASSAFAACLLALGKPQSVAPMRNIFCVSRRNWVMASKVGTTSLRTISRKSTLPKSEPLASAGMACDIW